MTFQQLGGCKYYESLSSHGLRWLCVRFHFTHIEGGSYENHTFIIFFLADCHGFLVRRIGGGTQSSGYR